MRVNITVEIPDDVLGMIVSAMGKAIGKNIAEELAKVVSPTSPTAVPPKPAGLITCKQVAKILCVSERTVWRMANDGEMPRPVRLGVSVRWPEDELLAWMRIGCPSAIDWAAVREKCMSVRPG